jgi:hypothetical protein
MVEAPYRTLRYEQYNAVHHFLPEKEASVQNTLSDETEFRARVGSNTSATEILYVSFLGLDAQRLEKNSDIY